MSSVRRKGPVISLNCSAFIGNLSSSEGVHARARANHGKMMRNAIEGNHLNREITVFNMMEDPQTSH